MTAGGGIDAIPRAQGRLPLLGHAWPLARDPYGFLENLRRADKDSHGVVRADVPAMPMVFATRPETIHQVLVTHARFFDKGRIYSRVADFVGGEEIGTPGGLATAKRDDHRRHRRLMQPQFHHKRLEDYARIMTDQANQLAQSWQPGQHVDVAQEMGEYAISTLARCMFASSTLGEEAIRAVRRDIPIILKTMLTRATIPPFLDRLPIPPNRQFLAASARLRAVIDQVIRDTSNTSGDGTDLLSLLMAARDADTGARLSDAEVRDELATILFAGSETTTTVLVRVLVELARHPDIEQAVLQELHEVLGDRAVTIGDVSELPLLRRVFDEVLRLGSVTLLSRRTNAQVELGPYTLPPGTEVAFSLYALHRDPDLYPDPHRFDPDRWLPENSSDRPRGAWLGFGAGNRMCIGDEFSRTESILTLATVLRRWKLDLAPGASPTIAVSAMPRMNRAPMIVTPRETSLAA